MHLIKHRSPNYNLVFSLSLLLHVKRTSLHRAKDGVYKQLTLAGIYWQSCHKTYL